MPYNFVADSFHTKNLCSRSSTSGVRFYAENGRFAFLSSFWGAWWAIYDDRLRLIRKRVMDFLLALNELFFARCYGWGATRRYQLKIGDFGPTRSVWTKILGRRGRPHQPVFSRKIRLNDLSYGIKSGQIFLPFCHNSPVWQTDRRTDTFLAIWPPALHSMQRGKNVLTIRRRKTRHRLVDCAIKTALCSQNRVLL